MPGLPQRPDITPHTMFPTCEDAVRMHSLRDGPVPGATARKHTHCKHMSHHNTHCNPTMNAGPCWLESPTTTCPHHTPNSPITPQGVPSLGSLDRVKTTTTHTSGSKATLHTFAATCAPDNGHACGPLSRPELSPRASAHLAMYERLAFSLAPNHATARQEARVVGRARACERR